LGERELCKLEVVGSIPIGSTSQTYANVRDGISVFEHAKHLTCGRMSPSLKL
jgi:hypothetical protein